MLTTHEQVRQAEAAAETISSRVGRAARVGIILGSGLGGLADEIEDAVAVPYADIPGFPLSTVEGHSGRLLAGRLRGVRVLAMQGRFHLYEGYTAQQVAFPVRVMATLGVTALLVSNAAGGMHPLMRRGDLMLLTDHVNLQGANALTGPNVDAWGPRFPDLSDAYSPRLRRLAEASALARGIALRQGVYVAVAGPNLETPAEYRFLRAIGGDAVGMSTVPEVTVARHMGLECLAMSVITDECFPDCLVPVSHAEIVAAAAAAEPHLTAILGDVVEALA